jgi:hypothetical protein
MAMRKGFLLLNNQIEIIEDLSDEQAGQLLKAFYDYNNGNEVKLKGLMNSIFKQFKVIFDENEQRYQEKCEKNKKNIEEYWKKVKEEKNTNEYERKRMNTMATNININKNINTNINTNESKLNNNNININKSERDQSFTPTASPTLAEIYNYACTLDINDKDYCEKFYNHYESIGWVNGTGREIKNWKLVFNNWLKKDNKQNDRREINQECNLQ